MTELTPMLASIGSEVPTGDSWVFEPKYDGIRILAFAAGGRARLVSRNGLEKTRQFPEIAEAAIVLSTRAKRQFIVDGEIVVMRGDTPARFQALQSRMHVTDRKAIESHRRDTPAALIVFDILLDGTTSLVTEPWRVRRSHLAALLQPPGRSNALRLSDVGEDGEAMLAKARRNGWEGIIAKRADSRYEPGRRSRSWIKLKIEKRQEFVVGGWTEPRNSRQHIGAILLGYYDGNGALTYAGHTGTGFSAASLRNMYARLRRSERRTSPFSTPPRTNERAHWTRPATVVEIKFNEWTTDGKLRQPVFVGLRDDKEPRDVIRERTESAAPPAAITSRDAARVATQLEALESAGEDGVVRLPGSSEELEVSNLGKVFFPSTRHTKGDVMRFYARVAPMLLPAIADRPLVMKRFPNGVRGKAFYQQRAPANPPPSVRVESVSDEGLTTQPRLVGGDLATLLYVVQLAAISIDPWHSRVQSVQFADYSVIDLDPGARAPFNRVVEVAHEVKIVLEELGLRAIPKTSGASGLHVVVPLPPGVPNAGARMIAELIATKVANRKPRIATTERSVNARPKGTVYVDFLQNIRGKTVAGVYSVRARPQPTVSTPLLWSEVTEGLSPLAFTIDTVLPRLRERGDLWAKGMRRPNSLEGIIGRD
jgi:bifunctional non-homologous end joining protein LigD